MKKLLLLTAGVTIMTAPAMAVYKCLEVNDTTICGTLTTISNGTLDWLGHCGFTVYGIAGCSDQQGSTMGETASEITTSQYGENRYCWCKMVSPVVSEWTYRIDGSNSDSCLYSCARNCANALQYEAFRTGLLSNLRD